MRLKVALLALLAAGLIVLMSPARAGIISPVPDNKELPDWRGATTMMTCLSDSALTNYLSNIQQFEFIFQETGRFVAPDCIRFPERAELPVGPVAEYIYTLDDGSSFVIMSLTVDGTDYWIFANEKVLQEKQTY